MSEKLATEKIVDPIEKLLEIPQENLTDTDRKTLAQALDDNWRRMYLIESYRDTNFWTPDVATNSGRILAEILNRNGRIVTKLGAHAHERTFEKYSLWELRFEAMLVLQDNGFLPTKYFKRTNPEVRIENADYDWEYVTIRKDLRSVGNEKLAEALEKKLHA